tara:strand:+ start:792 stop:1313 length:522 start_codon:yes stop_codon:yes gene_type:complete
MSALSVIEEMVMLNHAIQSRGISALITAPKRESVSEIPKQEKVRENPIAPVIPKTPEPVSPAPSALKWGGTNPYTLNTPDDMEKQRAFYKAKDWRKRMAYVDQCLDSKVWLASDGVVSHVTIMSPAHLANTINYIERKLSIQEKPIWGKGSLWLPILLSEAERRLEDAGLPQQ